MGKPRTSEAVFNSELGKILRGKHPRWAKRVFVEQTNILEESKGLKPDIIVHHPGGLPVSLETEYAPARTVEDDSRDRLGKTLGQTGETLEQSIAVEIPKILAESGQGDLGSHIEKANLKFCVFSGVDPENPKRWPRKGWIEGDVDHLAEIIEFVSLSENRVARGMEILELGIEQAANQLRDACPEESDTLRSNAENLHQKDGLQTSRMAMAIIANALTFQTSIAGKYGVGVLDEMRSQVSGKMLKTKVLDVWRHILYDINYWPIFKIASDLLLPIRDNVASKILDLLARVATELDSLGTTSQYDLSGRMFQRLISDRKFLATFYTLPSSAALLAEFAIERLDVDWSDAETITEMRVADFACGTGALLNAAYGAILSRYRRSGGDDREIHPRMMERAIIGTDIMPAATHLTASVLSSSHPSTIFKNTAILTLPYGEQPKETGPQVALGALDLIEGERTLPLFGTGRQRVRGVNAEEEGHVDLPHGGFDIVIMNPPFTRPTNHKKTGVPVPSFAGFSTSATEQKAMSKRLAEVRKPGMAGHGNAGLASYFIDVAHAKIRPGGILALVLPASFLQGESWENSRHLLSEFYKDITIVSIATEKTIARAFSADTNMAEVLVVATRRDGDDDPEGNAPNLRFVNLLGRPRSILEAKAVAHSIRLASVDQKEIKIGNKKKAGCILYGSLSETGYAGVQNGDVARFAAGLARGELRLPHRNDSFAVPIASMRAVADRGLLHRDINGADGRGPFDIEPLGEVAPTYPALWEHDTKRERKLVVSPNFEGVVRHGMKKEANDVWDQTKSRLHHNLDFGLTAQSLTICLTDSPSMGGRAWPNLKPYKEEHEIPLLLWGNSTLGLILFWWFGSRQHTGRAMLTISQLPDFPTIDASSLSGRQIRDFEGAYESFKDQEFLPANEAYRDEMRMLLDAKVLEILGFPDVLDDLSVVRVLWCHEPSVHAGKSTRPERGA